MSLAKVLALALCPILRQAQHERSGVKTSAFQRSSASISSVS
jgi:hypothetical protein